MPTPVYLDHNATTPLDPEALAAMRPFLEQHFGNPSSGHAFGRAAREALAVARARVAALLGCAAEEVVFTGGGTESNNMALIGSVAARGRDGGHVVTSRIEHPSVVAACHHLERRYGCRVTWLPVDAGGRVDPGDVQRALAGDTVVVSVMHANNETGVLQPIAEIAGVVARHGGAVLHTDAAQSAGRVPATVKVLGAGLLTLAGHKLHGPKGVGALVARTGVELGAVLHGAGQEGGRRPGTENVAGIAGLGAACSRAQALLAPESARQSALRDRLWGTLQAEGWLLNGHPGERLPNTLNVSLEGADGAEVLALAPEVAASTGSACHAGRTEPSAVLLAMGLTERRALGAVRLSLGRSTTEQDVDRAAAALVRAGRAARRGVPAPAG
jgi:cysteine desulfurase